MPLVQRFAQVFGAIYLLVGIMGFIPPLLTGKTPDSSFMGLLLGLFYVNWLHSLTHLLIGVVGLATYRSPRSVVCVGIGLWRDVPRRPPAAQRMGQCPAPPDRAGGVRSLLRLARDCGDDHCFAVEKRGGSLIQRLPFKKNPASSVSKRGYLCQ
jgi:Domain of unknown function (DUF4383)